MLLDQSSRLKRSLKKKIPDITNMKYWIPTYAGMTG